MPGFSCSYSIKVLHLLGKAETSDRYRLGAPICTCVAEWLGHGLQIRIMQVRSLSRTPQISMVDSTWLCGGPL
jgi:hypothetical protein